MANGELIIQDGKRGSLPRASQNATLRVKCSLKARENECVYHISPCFRDHPHCINKRAFYGVDNKRVFTVGCVRCSCQPAPAQSVPGRWLWELYRVVDIGIKLLVCYGYIMYGFKLFVFVVDVISEQKTFTH